jgi:hypothetical protein
MTNSGHSDHFQMRFICLVLSAQSSSYIAKIATKSNNKAKRSLTENVIKKDQHIFAIYDELWALRPFSDAIYLSCFIAFIYTWLWIIASENGLSAQSSSYIAKIATKSNNKAKRSLTENVIKKDEEEELMIYCVGLFL